MSEEFEAFIKSQLKALQAQIEIIKGYLNEYEEKNRKLKRIMSEELIAALILRFEKNDEKVIKLEEKLESLHFDLKEKLSQEIKNIKNELIDAQLSRSISRLLEEREIRVDSKPLDDLKESY